MKLNKNYFKKGKSKHGQPSKTVGNPSAEG